MATSLFYLIIRNFSYFRPKGVLLFLSCKLRIFTAHGVVNYHFANLVNVWKNLWKPQEAKGLKTSNNQRLGSAFKINDLDPRLPPQAKLEIISSIFAKTAGDAR